MTTPSSSIFEMAFDVGKDAEATRKIYSDVLEAVAKLGGKARTRKIAKYLTEHSSGVFTDDCRRAQPIVRVALNKAVGLKELRYTNGKYQICGLTPRSPAGKETDKTNNDNNHPPGKKTKKPRCQWQTRRKAVDAGGPEFLERERVEQRMSEEERKRKAVAGCAQIPPETPGVGKYFPFENYIEDGKVSKQWNFAAEKAFEVL